MTKYSTIVISRQMGSGGSWIAREVAKRLGFKYLDREILSQAAAMLEEDESALLGREERIASIWDAVLQACGLCVPEAGYASPPIRQINEDDLYDAESRIIKNAAKSHRCVIVGRGAWHILRENPGLLSVFIHASNRFRAQRINELHGQVDLQTAEALVSNSDKQRRKFIREHTETEWTDANNYMLCLDTGRIGLSGAVDIIIETARLYGETNSTRI